MRQLLIINLLLVLGASCKRDAATPTNNFSEASYLITISGNWNSPRFSTPAGAHFTYFSGIIHNSSGHMWQAGEKATPGLEAIAETGNQFPLFAEVDSVIAKKQAIGQINIPPPSPAGTISRTIYCNSNFSYISFASMIAPSPDWFTGVHDIALYNKGAWLADTTIQLFAYDAGTEEGDVFGYDNPETKPQQPIALLTPATATVLANGNTRLAPIASVRITRQ